MNDVFTFMSNYDGAVLIYQFCTRWTTSTVFFLSSSQSRYGPPRNTEYRVIVENLSSRVSWQVCYSFLFLSPFSLYGETYPRAAWLFFGWWSDRRGPLWWRLRILFSSLSLLNAPNVQRLPGVDLAATLWRWWGHHYPTTTPPNKGRWWWAADEDNTLLWSFAGAAMVEQTKLHTALCRRVNSNKPKMGAEERSLQTPLFPLVSFSSSTASPGGAHIFSDDGHDDSLALWMANLPACLTFIHATRDLCAQVNTAAAALLPKDLRTHTDLLRLHKQTYNTHSRTN